MKIIPHNFKPFRQWTPPDSRLRIIKIIIDVYPYIHADVFARDEEGNEYVFGVPYDNEGMLFYEIQADKTIQKDPPKNYPEPPICPFCKEKGVITKFFNFCRIKRYQYKCPKCFLTLYKNI